MTLKELRALDAFLAPFGEGLSDKPLFDKPNPIQALVDKGRVTIILGAYARAAAQRNDLSRWDVHALAYLVPKIEFRRPGIDLKIEDILVEKALAPPSGPVATGRSVCCIGSPRACFATECLLADMFGVETFWEWESPRVPIHFVWCEEIELLYRSAFNRGPAGAYRADPLLARRLLKNELRGALVVKGTVYEDASPQEGGPLEGRSYGIVVVQQRADGSVWMVLAGLTGPATYACAVLAGSGQTGAVPDPEGPDEHSQIRWDVVEATVERRLDLQGDHRVVTSCRILNSGLEDWARELD
jgi:hypothetical protein